MSAQVAAVSAPAAAVRVVAAMWGRELIRYRRDRSQIFGAVSRTVLWLIILGFGLGAALRDIEGYTYAQYILPGVVTLNILFASLQCAIALVWDREVGLLREVLVSPAPMPAVALGKIFGGATIAVIQGSIPLLAIPFLGLAIQPVQLLLAWAVMFSMGVLVTSFGVIVASRMTTFEGFGSISNGIIQPLYFLSGSIYPLKGIVGGIGFLDIPATLREELRQLGIFAIGSGWVVQLPLWLEILVYANPLSYQLDLLRYLILGFQQLPLALDLAAVLALPLVAATIATIMMNALRRR
jgi:ABC-2 type transport system permease protein